MNDPRVVKITDMALLAEAFLSPQSQSLAQLVETPHAVPKLQHWGGKKFKASLSAFAESADAERIRRSIRAQFVRKLSSKDRKKLKDDAGAAAEMAELVEFYVPIVLAFRGAAAQISRREWDMHAKTEAVALAKERLADAKVKPASHAEWIEAAWKLTRADWARNAYRDLRIIVDYLPDTPDELTEAGFHVDATYLTAVAAEQDGTIARLGKRAALGRKIHKGQGGVLLCWAGEFLKQRAKLNLTALRHRSPLAREHTKAGPRPIWRATLGLEVFNV